jgi:hypothetical protein
MTELDRLITEMGGAEPLDEQRRDYIAVAAFIKAIDEHLTPLLPSIGWILEPYRDAQEKEEPSTADVDDEPLHVTRPTMENAQQAVIDKVNDTLLRGFAGQPESTMTAIRSNWIKWIASASDDEFAHFHATVGEIAFGADEDGEPADEITPSA